MRELNKFQITTVIFLLMFVFVVGAIYTNTKDAVKQKNGQYATNSQEATDNYQYEQTRSNLKFSDVDARINKLDEQINEIKNNNEQKSANFKCRIYGITGIDGFIQTTIDEALTEARDNGREIVFTCTY